MGPADWIQLVEAAYDLDAPEEQWLRGVLGASAKLLDRGLGAFAYLYDASVPTRMRIDRYVATPNQVSFDEDFIRAGIAHATPDYVRATFLTLTTATTMETPGFKGSPGEAHFRKSGVGDVLGINGVDPSGIGVWVGVPLDAVLKLSVKERLRWDRIASHLASSYRLHRRAAAASFSRRSPWGADAILSPRGRLEHAANDAVTLAATRERLRDAAIAIDRARGKLRRVDPDKALGEWTGLVEGRWSLVDKFDRDGKRYVLARSNEANVGGLASLTHRERQVTAYAALGHANKLIAYDLGIAHATVRVLLARAATKLGATSRAELVEMVRGADSD